MDNILLSTFLPLLDYTSDMVNSAFTKVNATDYAIAEFDLRWYGVCSSCQDV